jgi:hypothetical protein
VGEGGGGIHGAVVWEEEEVVLGRHSEEEEGRVGCVGWLAAGPKVKEKFFSE